MEVLTVSPPSASACHAEAILRAWILGDLSRLRQVLESSRQLGCSDVAIDQPDERLELLSVVANRILASVDLSAPAESDPQIRLCMSLLAHLVAKPRFD